MATQLSRNLLLKPEVRARTRLSDSTLWRCVRAGTFPPPIKLGERRVAWYEDEVDGWISTRPTAEGIVGPGSVSE